MKNENDKNAIAKCVVELHTVLALCKTPCKTC